MDSKHLTVDAGLRAARRANLTRLLHARSLVFVGGRNVESAIVYCRRLGYGGVIQAVNPTRTEIAGVPCVPRLADLEVAPEAAFVAVPPAATVAVVDELRAMGAAGAVCYAAGFAELDEAGAALQTDLAAAAGEMALIGPNTMGLVSLAGRLGLNHADHGIDCPAQGVAMIAQSGTVGTNTVLSDRSLPVTHLIAVGNQAAVDIADAIAVLVCEPEVRVAMLHLEGIRDAAALQGALRLAREREVPVVAFRTGVSAQARAIAVTHTGGMTGAGETLDCFLTGEGVLIAEDYAAFIETGKLLVRHPRGLAGRRLAVFTASGADAGFAADLADRQGLTLDAPSAACLADLEALLPPVARAANPMDITMALWGDVEGQRRVYRRLMEEAYDAALIVINCPDAALDSRPEYDQALAALVAAGEGLALPVFAASNLPEGLPADARAALGAAGIVALQGLEAAFAALALAAAHGGKSKARRGDLLALPALTGEAATCDEWASKAWLRAAGIATPRAHLARGAEEAAAEAERVGYPLVAKAVGAGLAHKSEQGAVVLGLADQDSVRAAAARLLALPGAEAVLVEEQVGDGVAEIILGITRDPVFGLVLLVGAGGVLTELLADKALFLLPVSAAELRARLPKLKVWRLLEGYRGQPPGDREALVQAILALARRAEAEAASLLECDVNPLMVRPEGRGVIAVDALVSIDGGGDRP